MKQNPSYSKFVSRIEKAEFISLYSEQKTEDWFSEKELKLFSFPRNAGSLAGRFLVKRMIKDFIMKPIKPEEIEILNDVYGRPEITMSSEVLNATRNAGIKKILCSISHSRNYITGITVFCFENAEND